MGRPIGAAHEVVKVLRDVGIEMKGQQVADIGCGDGIIDLALAHLAEPAALVGYDLKPTQTSILLERSRTNGFAQELPANLTFEASSPERVPSDDHSYDIVISWSAFEHVSDPDAMSNEIHRILRPGGVLFLQLWPFFFSQHGSHLMEWYPDGFAHLTHEPERLRSALVDGRTDDGRSDYMWSEYLTLNRITVDDLGDSLRAAGFRISRLELLSNVVNLPGGLDSIPLSHLGVAGVKLIAIA